MPKEVQSGITYKKLSNGDYDTVDSLFSDEGLDFNDGTKDPYNITVGNNNQHKEDDYTD